jgi:hypothetical protein
MRREIVVGDRDIERRYASDVAELPAVTIAH